MAGNVIGKMALAVVCCCGFGVALLSFLFAVNPWTERNAIPVFGSRLADTVLFGMGGLVCGFMTMRLIQGKRWAWWAALIASVLALGFGMFVFYSALNPQSDFARSESGFGIGLSIVLMTPSLISGLMLLLPCVRRRFAFDRLPSQLA